MIDRMGAALAGRRAERYEVRAISRSSHRLYLAIRTFMILDARTSVASAAGVIDLQHTEFPKTYFDLGGVKTP